MKTIIKEADKSSAVVILDKTYYETKRNETNKHRQWYHFKNYEILQNTQTSN